MTTIQEIKNLRSNLLKYFPRKNTDSNIPKVINPKFLSAAPNKKFVVLEVFRYWNKMDPAKRKIQTNSIFETVKLRLALFCNKSTNAAKNTGSDIPSILRRILGANLFSPICR
jgi:hypothetical protein